MKKNKQKKSQPVNKQVKISKKKNTITWADLERCLSIPARLHRISV